MYMTKTDFFFVALNLPDTDDDLFDEPGTTGQHVTLLLSINIVLCIFILICVFISINDKLKKIRCRAQRNDKPSSKKPITKKEHYLGGMHCLNQIHVNYPQDQK